MGTTKLISRRGQISLVAEKPKYKIVENLKLGELATFAPNKKLPVYNWFYFKESFSRDLVSELAKQFQLDKDTLVLDPFAGAGTTVLTCKQLGVPSIGIDAFPLSVFASQVKLKANRMDMQAAIEAEAIIAKMKYEPQRHARPPPSIVVRAFSKSNFDDLVFLRQKISELQDDVKAFLLLALARAAIESSYSKKDGAVIKIRPRPTPPVRKVFARMVEQMAKEAAAFETKDVFAAIEMGDARRLDRIGDATVSAVITSPPYLNNFDYARAYAIEEWVCFIHEPVPRPYIGLEKKEDPFLGERGEMPEVARDYFADMLEVLRELARVCKPGANVAMVVGSGCFVDERRVIDADVLLAELAERLGFATKKILVVNKRWCTTPARKKIAPARESILFLHKS